MILEEILGQLNALQTQKDFKGALALASRALKRFPDSGDLAVKAAEVFLAVKNYNIAYGLISKVVQRLSQAKRPVPAEVLTRFGQLSIRRNKITEARQAFEKLIAANIRTQAVFVGLGHVALKENNTDLAEAHARAAIALESDSHDCNLLMARICLDRKQLDSAIEWLEKNIKRPDVHGESVDLWLSTLKNQNKLRYAQDVLHEQANQYPKVLEFVYGFAALAHRSGEYKLARPSLEKALKLSPANYRILYELAVLERLSGNIPDSMSYVERSLECFPDNPPALRIHAMEHKFAFGDPQFSRLNYASANYAAFKDADQIQLHYALAKAFDDAGDFDVAFRHYAIGGEKKLQKAAYEPASVDKMLGMLTTYITADNIKATNDRGTEDETPVFILGMPRSGTSLLEQILASHPDVYGAGELRFLSSVIENMIIKNDAIHVGDNEPVFPSGEFASWKARGDHYSQHLHKLAGEPKKRIVDKMPGNYNYVGMINALMPKAHVIHSQRHPLDTCLSCYRILFSEGQTWSYSLADLAHQYRKYWDLMAHWRQQFPGFMYEVYYEQTVADVEGQARALIDYLGLPWDDNCLNFHKTDRAVKTASASQVRKPIYSTSAYRWKKYESYLQPLIEELGDIVQEYEERVQQRIESRTFGAQAF